MISQAMKHVPGRPPFPRLLGVAAAVLVAGVIGQSATAGAQALYDRAALAADQQRYTERVAFLLQRGLLDFATAEEKRALDGVLVDHPLRGRDLLSVEATVIAGTPVVTAPVEALKFIEDLSVAYAWRFTNRYSLEPMDEYVAMLKHRPAADFPNDRPPDPMTALGVPERIWEQDPRVDDLSLRFRNTAWAFILAHELGHLRFGHTLTPASPPEVQRQEEQADAFAVDLLARSETIPMGMILWFQATAGYLKNRADFASDAAYAEWLMSEASHPVNGRRMRSLATALDRQATAARDPNSADTLRFIAGRLAAIGEIVEDRDMQRYLRRCAAARHPEELRRLEDRPCF